jgi:hypothetical protein
MSMAIAADVELLLALGRFDEPRELLAELAGERPSREDCYYLAYLPGLVRAALALETGAVAARLVEGVEPTTPLAEHALCACAATLSEAGSRYVEAAARYAEAAERWRGFGDRPETAFALLGQGRCLRALGDAGAEAPLLDARGLFASMGFAPAIAEVEALLGSAEVAAR